MRLKDRILTNPRVRDLDSTVVVRTQKFQLNLELSNLITWTGCRFPDLDAIHPGIMGTSMVEEVVVPWRQGELKGAGWYPLPRSG